MRLLNSVGNLVIAEQIDQVNNFPGKFIINGRLNTHSAFLNLGLIWETGNSSGF